MSFHNAGCQPVRYVHLKWTGRQSWPYWMMHHPWCCNSSHFSSSDSGKVAPRRGDRLRLLALSVSSSMRRSYSASVNGSMMSEEERVVPTGLSVGRAGGAQKGCSHRMRAQERSRTMPPRKREITHDASLVLGRDHAPCLPVVRKMCIFKIEVCDTSQKNMIGQ